MSVLICQILPLPLGPEAASAAGEIYDFWDMPVDLETICDGSEALVFICNLDVAICREGAIHFDSRAPHIRAQGLRPVAIFIGRPEDVREAVVNLDLHVPVYIDPHGWILSRPGGQSVVPALARLDTDGTVARTVYGGGEVLDDNIELLLAGRSRRFPWKTIGLGVVVVIGIILLLGD